MSPTSASIDVAGSAAYSVQFTTMGDDGSPAFTENSDSSPDLAVSPTGLLTTSGTTLTAGSYSADGSVSDVSGDLGTWSFTLTVTGDTITVSPTSASVAVGGSSAYTTTLVPTGNNGTVSFSQSSGSPQISVSSGGVVTTSGTTLAAGSYSADGSVSDASGDLGAWSFTLTVTSSSTTTTIGSVSPTGPTVGQPVTVDVLVSPTPDGGSVTFFDNGSTIACTGGDQTVNTSTGDASCEFAYTSTAGNPQTITATYSGDPTGYLTSTSGGVSLTVNPGPTKMTTVSFAPGSYTYGQSITYSASVTGTGTSAGAQPDNGTPVTFTVGSITLCSGPIESGTASCSATNTPAGSPTTVTAAYPGDANFLSTSGTTSPTVHKATPTTSIKLSSSSVPYGTAITYGVGVSPGSTVNAQDTSELPTGVVNVTVGGVTVCTVTLTPSTGDFDDCNVATAPLGPRQLVAASYVGDSNFVGSTAFTTLTVTQGTQTITFSPPSSASLGATATLSATGGPSGNPVLFSLDASSGSGVCVLTGPGSTTVVFTGVGTCVIDANQAGNVDYLPASQNTEAIAVVVGSGQTSGGGSPTFVPNGPANAPPPAGLPAADFGTPATWTIGAGGSPTVTEILDGAKITVTVPAAALPNGTTVSLYPVTCARAIASLLPEGKS
ncbi:MAG: Ig-like domain repeat protein, partial [Acidimicrobiales bacterium]